MPTPTTNLCNYIRRKEVIMFMYADSLRVVEPHLLGRDESGDLTLSAWQLSGATGSGWRDYHVEKMTSIDATNRSFKNARPGFNPNDTTIKTIICRLTPRRNPGQKRRKK